MLRRRVNALMLLVLLAGGVLIARLAQVQLLCGRGVDLSRYSWAGGSHLVETVRGGIYTRWGTPLAVQEPTFDLGVYYGELPADQWRRALHALCGAAPDELAARAREIIENVERIEAHVRRKLGRDDIRVAERYQYHCVIEDVPAEVAALLRSRPDLVPPAGDDGSRPAVQVIERTHRRYPNGALAPHAVGRVAPMTAELWAELDAREATWRMGEPFERIRGRYKMDDRVGVLGVEKAREHLLRGEHGYVRKRLRFRLLGYDTVSERTPPQAGADVYLTLREDFQRAANDALARAAADEGLAFTSGALVIVDVRDGAVLAAATYPSYDGATFSERYAELAADPRSPLLFRPHQGALPTGSVYKVITAVAALAQGAIRPSTAFTCARREVFRAGGAARTFHCTGHHGTLALVPAIEKSCNIYFYHTGLAAGGEALARWGRAFGLGVPTGVDLPYERAGQVPEPRHTYGVLNLSIGQGELLATPLQVACAMGAVANGARLYTPHFFDHARGADGELVESYEPQWREPGVSAAMLRTVREGMRRAVETGTARRAGLEPFRAAGKTGTAELGSGQPNHAWFAGFAPFEEPKVAFAVVSERNPGHGGSHAAPIMAMALEPIWPAVEAMP